MLKDANAREALFGNIHFKTKPPFSATSTLRGNKNRLRAAALEKLSAGEKCRSNLRGISEIAPFFVVHFPVAAHTEVLVAQKSREAELNERVHVNKSRGR